MFMSESLKKEKQIKSSQTTKDYYKDYYKVCYIGKKFQ